MAVSVRVDRREDACPAATGSVVRRGTTAALVVVVAAAVVPSILGISVRAGTAPPLLADWRPRIGPGTLPSLALAALACSPALHRAFGRLGWRRLLGAAWLLGVAWMLSLALVDGPGGISRPLDQSTEYLPTARALDDVPETLRGFVDRIPFDRADHWAVHVAGHPPGALLLFVALARVGLASGPAAGLVVVAVAATTPLAVAVALRALGAEHAARIALPFLVIGPAAVWQAVSADAVFAAVGAWGTAALAISTTPGHRHSAPWRAAAWAALAGMLYGACVFLSYGLVLLLLLALGVLVASRRWLPLVVAIPAALAVAVAFATAGFAWWEAFPVLRERYADGIASQRPAAYWLWANLAALAICAGPVIIGAVWAALARLGVRVVRGRRLPQLRWSSDGATPVLVAAAVAMVAVADLSLMSKAEVERIWLPFVPWLAISAAMLPPARRRPALASQAVLAVAVQHVLWTPW
jgi:methylthioxylose transferase